jgi:hypothetical protein
MPLYREIVFHLSLYLASKLCLPCGIERCKSLVSSLVGIP